MDIQDVLISRFSILKYEIAIAGDGGTIGFEIKGINGETYQLFVDRRINTKTRDHLYAYYHPSDNKSFYLGLNEAVLAKLDMVVLSTTD